MTQFDELDISKIKVVPSDTEVPVHDFPTQTKRNLCASTPENLTLLERVDAVKVITDIEENIESNPQLVCQIAQETIEELNAVFNPLSTLDCSPDLFTETVLVIDNISELRVKLSEVLIRFDTNPEHYTKEDYFALLQVLYLSLYYLYSINGHLVTEWSSPLSHENIPSEKLVKETIDLEASTRSALDTLLLNQINTKLNTLIAGNNIQINSNVISATDTTYTAGEGISITGNVISNTRDSALWGNITGSISNLTDLLTQFNTKLNSLIAGSNIQINLNTISATDTVYNDTEVRGLISGNTQSINTLSQNKQDTLIAGSNVTISNNVISASDQLQSDWNQTNTSSKDYIKNKPSIPTKTSQLTNDSGFLTSHLSIKTINGLSIVGSGNVNIVTYNPFPSSWTTSGTLLLVVTSILSDSTLTKLGMAYLGGILGSCTPFGYGNVECKVEFMLNGLAVLSVNSSDIYPHSWFYNTASGDYTWKTFSNASASTSSVSGASTALSITIDGTAYNLPSSSASVQSDWNQSDSTQADYIKNKPTIPSLTSQLTNDSGFLTASSISGKEDSSNKVSSFLSTPDHTHYPSEKLVKDTISALSSSLTEETNARINMGTLLNSRISTLEGTSFTTTEHTTLSEFCTLTSQNVYDELERTDTI